MIAVAIGTAWLCVGCDEDCPLGPNIGGNLDIFFSEGTNLAVAGASIEVWVYEDDQLFYARTFECDEDPCTLELQPNGGAGFESEEESGGY